MDEAFEPILEVLKKKTRLKAKKFMVKFKDNGIEERAVRGAFRPPLGYLPNVPEGYARLKAWKRRMEDAVTLYS
jgi:hypothetical protein